MHKPTPLRTLALIALTLATIAVVPQAARATTTPKTALVYGDSLTTESRIIIYRRIVRHAGWAATVSGRFGTAPCDWLAPITADLDSIHPSVVAITTAGNTGLTPCMTAPIGSVAYYTQYRSDLDTIFAAVTNSGAQLVFFAAPPFLDPARDAATNQLTVIATDLARRYAGVTISQRVRTGLSINGVYTQTKPCAAGETVTMGCDPSTNRIEIRTSSSYPDYGLHLCPSGAQSWISGICPTYSSGAIRFGRAIGDGVTALPALLVGA